MFQRLKWEIVAWWRKAQIHKRDRLSGMPCGCMKSRRRHGFAANDLGTCELEWFWRVSYWLKRKTRTSPSRIA